MSLKDTLDTRFKGEAQVISTDVKNVRWVQLPCQLNDSFTDINKEQIEEINRNLKYSDLHAQVIFLDYSGSTAVYTTVQIGYEHLEFLRTNDSEITKPRILSSLGLYKTLDDYFIFDRRSPSLRTYPNKIHIIGGGADPNKDQTPLETLKREGIEELGIKDTDIQITKLLGISRELRTGFEQVLYYAGLNVNAEEIIEKRKNVQLNEGEPIFVPDLKFDQFIINNWGEFVPTALVNCLIYGYKYKSTKWAEKILQETQNKPLTKDAM